MNQRSISRKRFNTLATAILLLLLPGIMVAQSTKKRTIEKSFDGKTALWASHRHGNLVLKRGSGSQIKVILTLTANGKDDQETEKFLNEFDLNASDGPDNKLDIQTSAYIQNWNIIGTKSTIKMKNGETYHGIKDFNMDMEIYVPKLRYATLENKYAAVKSEDGTTSILEVKLYDGKIDLQGTYDQLNLQVKYSDGAVGNFSSCKAEFYDSDVTFGNGGSFEMETKYSGIKIGNLQSLKLDAYDDDFRIGAVSGLTEIRDKYSEFRFSGNIGNANLALYDSKIDARNADQVTISESKYTEYEFQEVTTLHFSESYDDVVILSKVGSLGADRSKYTEYKAGGLWKNLRFPESYDDDITVSSVGGTFDGMVFNGKYTDVILPIPADVKYELTAETKYSKIFYNESAMESTYYKEKGDEISLKGRVKGADANAPKIDIKSYDGDVKLTR